MKEILIQIKFFLAILLNEFLTGFFFIMIMILYFVINLFYNEFGNEFFFI